MGESYFCFTYAGCWYKDGDIMWYLYLIFGILSGVIGGMGMGGGTLLIPLITIFCGISQILAQCYNLLAFLPMSIIAIIIHYKNKYIKAKCLPILIIFGIIFSVLGSFIANLIDKNILKILFGVFLIILSLIEFLRLIKNKNDICND